MANPVEYVAALLRESTFLRFLVAGGINTLFGFAMYGASLALGAPVWMALLIGTVMGTVFNFFTTGGYAFRQLALSRYPRFVVFYLLLYGLNLALLHGLSRWIDHPLAAQAVLACPLALLSFYMMSRFVFPHE